VFDEWKSRLKRCIDAEGEYLSNEQFDFDVLFAAKEFYRAPGLNTPL
jgi:hypothetical protein